MQRLRGPAVQRNMLEQIGSLNTNDVLQILSRSIEHKPQTIPSRDIPMTYTNKPVATIPQHALENFVNVEAEKHIQLAGDNDTILRRIADQRSYLATAPQHHYRA